MTGAEAVSWATVITAAQILGIVSGIVSTVVLRSKLREIGEQLSTVIQLQQQILGEIRRLRLYFREALRAEWIHHVSVELAGQADRFDVVMAGVEDGTEIPPATRQRLVGLLAEVQQTAFELRHYGVAAYQSTYSAMCLMKAICAVLDWNKDEQAAAFSKFVRSAADWLDPKHGDSVVGLLNRVKAERSSIRRRLEKKPREYHIGFGSSSGELRCTWEDWLVIVGSLGDGYSGHVEQRKRECRPGPHVRDESVDRIEQDLRDRVTALLQSDGLDMGKGPELAGDGTMKYKANHPRVQEFNSLRARYFQLAGQQPRIEDVVASVKEMQFKAQEWAAVGSG